MSENVYGVIPQTGNTGRKAVVISAEKFEDLELYVPVLRLIEPAGPWTLPSSTAK